MKGLFKNFSLPENAEVMFLLMFGIILRDTIGQTYREDIARDIKIVFFWTLIPSTAFEWFFGFLNFIATHFQLLQVTDGSPFTMKERWVTVWDTELPVEYFSQFVQKIIKTVLSIIVVVRCATTYAYVVSAMLVIFCLLKASIPKLMLLWLVIAGLKSILLTFLEALAGVYVCSAFGQIRKACVEFVISKSMEIIFATYLWGSVLNIYQEMERKIAESKKPELWEQLLFQKEGGRQRARSLPDESTLYKTACLNNFEFKDVPQIILQMLRRRDEMSRDSLLDPGMMLASVSNMGSFDNLKTSQSLGELGFIDLRTAQVVGLEEDEIFSPREKALRFLKFTWSDVRRAQRNKTALESDIFRIDEDTWERVVTNGAHISLPKRPRAEVYIREVQQAEPEDDTRKPRKRSFDLKFSWSFFNLCAPKQAPLQETYDELDEESVTFREDEDEEGREETEEPTPLFMSNIKEGVVINRVRVNFGLKKMKGNAYAELYKQDYMSVIGPEVFDKATKLRKMTSLTRVNKWAEPILSIKLPEFSETADNKEFNFSNESEEKICQTLNSELDLKEFGDERQNTGDTEKTEEFGVLAIASDEETAWDKNLSQHSFHTESDQTLSDEELEKLESEEKVKFLGDKDLLQISEACKSASPVPSLSSSRELTNHSTETPACYKRRRIKIRRVGKPSTVANSSDSTNNLKNSDTDCYHQPPSKEAFDKENYNKPEMWSPRSNTSQKELTGKGKSLMGVQNDRIHFLVDLFQKPLLDVLLTYYDLRKKIGVTQNRQAGFIDFLFDRRYQEESHDRVWKSNVLKATEVYRRKSSWMNFSKIRQNKFITRKLLSYYLQKYYAAKAEEEALLPVCVRNGCGWLNFNYENLSHNALCSSGKTGLLKAESKLSFSENLKDTRRKTLCNTPGEDLTVRLRNTRCSAVDRRPRFDIISKAHFGDEENLRLSNRKILKSDTDFEKLKFKMQEKITEAQESFDADSVEGRPGEESVSSQESDEPISLYYSKAANLASPLLDVKRFIYPDHIHYSYKHVKNKGFDVDISGGFPLLARESLTMSTSLNDSVSAHPEFAITRRPMDLSFATTNAFTEWQNNDQSDIDSILSEAKKTKSRPRMETHVCKRERKPSHSDMIKNKNAKNAKKSKKSNDKDESHFSLKPECKAKVKPDQNRNFPEYLCPSKDYLLIEKLLKMHFQLNSKQFTELTNPERERTPLQISSTQLHSNKGRINSTYNPAIFLQENRTRNEKKKMETQEERTKDMFARLEREALLQSKNLHKTTTPLRRI